MKKNKTKGLFASIVLGVAVTACASASSSGTVTVVDRPDIQSVNTNYIGYRAPLRPLNFIKLPVGSIQPEGWVKKYLELQRDGLTGHLGEISAWLEKDNNAWLTTGGDHGWEEVPYWLKGYGNLAYILNDPKMIEETKYWIEGVFASCQPNGYFGPVNERNGKRELWAQMIMLWCLQSYYEYSQDQRVIDLMTNYFKWQMTVPDDQLLEDYWEKSRGGDNIISIYWLYNHTGDAFLLELAEKIHRKYVQVPYTTEFAILYLPIESLWAEVIKRPGLIERVHRISHVTIAGPTVLAALLNSLQLGFRTLAIEKKSEEVSIVLGKVKSEFLKFSEAFDAVDRKVDGVRTALENVRKRTNIMSKNLRDVETVSIAAPESAAALEAPAKAPEAPNN